MSSSASKTETRVGDMPKMLHRPDAKTGHAIGPSLLDRVSWDDLRVFAIAGKELSLRKAATALRTSSSTVVRRIERLEAILGVRLFDRLPDGVVLTSEGRSVLAAAQEMERASLSLRAQLDHELTRRAVVRCAVTEGLGTFWIVPHLAEFSRANPHTLVDLRCSTLSADVLRMEADVAIQLTRPDKPDQVVTRLGRLHIYPFASPRYAETYGLPRNADEMARHRLVHQTGPQLDQSPWSRFLGLPDFESLVIVRTNASAAHFYAVELGLGIGVLPSYALPLGSDLVPVDMGLLHQVDIWMTYHPDIRAVKRVATFIDWLRSLFDSKRYPWFADEFIHPDRLPKAEAPARVDLTTVKPIVAGLSYTRFSSDDGQQRSSLNRFEDVSSHRNVKRADRKS
jgi:DNA-binding transcriptional LysR family regulator